MYVAWSQDRLRGLHWARNAMFPCHDRISMKTVTAFLLLISLHCVHSSESGVTNSPSLEWESSSEAVLPVERGFSFELNVEGDAVQDIYTNGGYDHLRELAALCKREGWRIADAQEGEDIDLDNPYAGYEE